MAKLLGFSVDQEVAVKACMRSGSAALEKFIGAATGSDSKGFRRVFQMVMGSGSAADDKQAEAIMLKSAQSMLAVLRTQRYKIRYAVLAPNENANMVHAKYTQAESSSKSVLQFTEEASNFEALPMQLGPLFFNMPRISLSEQSQVETFLHELSHFGAGTVDQDAGGKCYGWDGCVRAKGQGPLFAVRNAENVGFLLTRYAF